MCAAQTKEGGSKYPGTALPIVKVKSSLKIAVKPTLGIARLFFFIAPALLSGCRATSPGKTETYVAVRAKRWLLVPNSRQANPLAATAANIDFGHASYSRYCNACHGLDGAGNGVAFSTRMSPPAPSLASAPVQAYSDSQLKWIVETGLGLPACQDRRASSRISRYGQSFCTCAI